MLMPSKSIPCIDQASTLTVFTADITMLDEEVFGKIWEVMKPGFIERNETPAETKARMNSRRYQQRFEDLIASEATRLNWTKEKTWNLYTTKVGQKVKNIRAKVSKGNGVEWQ